MYFYLVFVFSLYVCVLHNLYPKANINLRILLFSLETFVSILCIGHWTSIMIDDKKEDSFHYNAERFYSTTTTKNNVDVVRLLLLLLSSSYEARMMTFNIRRRIATKKMSFTSWSKERRDRSVFVNQPTNQSYRCRPVFALNLHSNLIRCLFFSFCLFDW